MINRGRSLSLFLCTDFTGTISSLTVFTSAANDRLSADVNRATSADMTGPNEPITWVWRSKQFAAVVKPAGLPTQAPQAYSSLESLLRLQLDDPQSYLAIPHRLDRPVAGLVLVAFTKRAARLLSEQFESRRINKTYMALVQGRYPESSGLWTDTICKMKGRAEVRLLRDADTRAGDSETYYVTPGSSQSDELEAGKPAITHVERLSFRGPDHTLLQLKPETGRMHQLRVQSAARGFPIVGDRQYGSSMTMDNPTMDNLGDDQIALFASHLEFFDPANGKPIEISAKLPSWCE